MLIVFRCIMEKFKEKAIELLNFIEKSAEKLTVVVEKIKKEPKIYIMLLSLGLIAVLAVNFL